MKTKVVAITMVLSTLATSAFAEQPNAQKYREILQTGKFYVEYELDDVKKSLVVQDNKRMDYTIYKKTGSMGVMMGLSLINPILAIGALAAGNKSKVPTAYYEAGKFYQFDSKKKATVAMWQQLDDPNIDPTKGWNTIKARLSLPEELAVFAPKDMFFEEVYGVRNPVFIESGKKVEKKKELIYDKYSYDVKNHAGNILFTKSFYMWYENGELVEIKSYINKPSEQEEFLHSLELKKITDVLPENALKIPTGCKVYAVGLGDMNDLIDQPVQVETY